MSHLLICSLTSNHSPCPHKHLTNWLLSCFRCREITVNEALVRVGTDRHSVKLIINSSATFDRDVVSSI